MIIKNNIIIIIRTIPECFAPEKFQLVVEGNAVPCVIYNCVNVIPHINVRVMTSLFTWLWQKYVLARGGGRTLNTPGTFFAYPCSNDRWRHIRSESVQLLPRAGKSNLTATVSFTRWVKWPYFSIGRKFSFSHFMSQADRLTGYFNLAFSEKCRHFFTPNFRGFYKSLVTMDSRYVKLHSNSLSCRIIIQLSKITKEGFYTIGNPINTLRFWGETAQENKLF